MTGATGFLGANLVRALLEAGHGVRVTVRPSSPTLAVDGLAVERVAMDLADPASVDAAVRGCDGVVHAAAAVWVGRTRAEELERVNVEGTRHVLQAAGEVGARLVQVSTVDALGLEEGRPADEGVARNMDRYADCAYVRTKRAADDLVAEAVREGLDARTVHPAYMIGPWDVGPTSGRMLLALARGHALLAPSGGNCFLDVRDAARSTVVALERGPTGRAWILGGDNLPYLEAWRRMAAVIGARPPLGTVPSLLARAAGALGGLWSRIGAEPEVNPVTVAFGELPHYFASERARAELGHPEPDLERAVADAWQWFGHYGYPP